MAGICNDCGAPTWGRYRVCPDCRKERKKNSRECEICGGSIKGSGRKYCSYCKNSKEARLRTDKTERIFPQKQETGNEKLVRLSIGIFGILLLVLLLFFLTINSEEEKNFKEQEKEISPEQELTNLCVSQFSNQGIFDFKKTSYQIDFSSASNWIENNYENSALTEEQKNHNINYILENQLPKEGYPIIISFGSKKVNPQVIENGFYYCNKNGIL